MARINALALDNKTHECFGCNPQFSILFVEVFEGEAYQQVVARYADGECWQECERIAYYAFEDCHHGCLQTPVDEVGEGEAETILGSALFLKGEGRGEEIVEYETNGVADGGGDFSSETYSIYKYDVNAKL